MLTILLTERFPYSYAETFLNEEIAYHSEELVIIPTFCGTTGTIRKLQTLHRENVIILKPQNLFFQNKKIARLLGAITAMMTSEFRQETYRLIRERQFTVERAAQLASFISKAYCITDYVAKLINEKYRGEERIVIYSYWMTSTALAAIKISQALSNVQAITRCHGYDLYERKENHMYTTMQKYIVERLDCIYSISEDGIRQIKSKFEVGKFNEKKLCVSRLGTLDHGLHKYEKHPGELHLVSCSSVIPLKRIHFILKAAANVHNAKVHWTHFGDGPLLAQIKKMTLDYPNVICEFKGQMENNQIFDYYQHECVDLFVNTSTSEGIPVSIMEAISFGIPIIAPNIGGISEIVENEKNGWLLRGSFDLNELTEKFEQFCQLSSDDVVRYRHAARQTWETKYNCVINYKNFVDSLTGKA